MGDVVNLDADEDQYSDQPRPKASVMTIRGADAIALNELMHYVNFRCFDGRFKGRGMMKSPALRQHLDRLREILATLLEYPEFARFYYNCPARDLPCENADRALLEATAGRSDLRFYSAAVYFAPERLPMGAVEIAVDEAAGEACGFSERNAFRKAAKAAGMSDEDIDDLIDHLGEHPDAGDEIVGTGGCRKLR
ncbi:MULTISPECIES: hypothetical protein [unclassified Rhizobium]|uniref:hypothetical protein n=1 Tax=unclassified Rhizobium TaxID=2613769 RepID=UPI0038307069